MITNNLRLSFALTTLMEHGNSDLFLMSFEDELYIVEPDEGNWCKYSLGENYNNKIENAELIDSLDRHLISLSEALVERVTLLLLAVKGNTIEEE